MRSEIAGMRPTDDMWRFIKRFDGRKSSSKPAATIDRPSTPGQPQPQRPATTDREKAELFAQTYQSVSRIPKNKREDRDIKLEARRASEKCACDDRRDGICSPFTQGELTAAISKIKNGRAPGVDGVTNDMIHHLPSTAQRHLLAIFNKCWKTAEVPAAWRRAEIVAIPKKGKNPADPNSYRPISLLNCISKLFERLVQNRLQHWMEERQLINCNQAGFRRLHSTIDQIARVTQTIFDAFEKPKPERAVIALLDFQKAYDRVWKDALLAKLGRLKVPAHVIRWLRDFLSDRRARCERFERASFERKSFERTIFSACHFSDTTFERLSNTAIFNVSESRVSAKPISATTI